MAGNYCNLFVSFFFKSYAQRCKIIQKYIIKLISNTETNHLLILNTSSIIFIDCFNTTVKRYILVQLSWRVNMLGWGDFLVSCCMMPPTSFNIFRSWREEVHTSTRPKQAKLALRLEVPSWFHKHSCSLVRWLWAMANYD